MGSVGQKEKWPSSFLVDTLVRISNNALNVKGIAHVKPFWHNSIIH